MWFSAFGCQIGQIDAQSLARNIGGGIMGEEMHTGDQHVLGNHQFIPVRHLHQRRIVL